MVWISRFGVSDLERLEAEGGLVDQLWSQRDLAACHLLEGFRIWGCRGFRFEIKRSRGLGMGFKLGFEGCGLRYLFWKVVAEVVVRRRRRHIHLQQLKTCSRLSFRTSEYIRWHVTLDWCLWSNSCSRRTPPEIHSPASRNSRRGKNPRRVQAPQVHLHPQPWMSSMLVQQGPRPIRCRARRGHPKTFQGLSSKQSLKIRSEFGLDRLMCAEFARQRHRRDVHLLPHFGWASMTHEKHSRDWRMTAKSCWGLSRVQGTG